MENLHQAHEKIKAVGRLKISSTAKAVGFVIAQTGVTCAKVLMELTGFPRATLYRALAEYYESGGYIPTSLTCPTSGNPTSLTYGNCSEKTVSLVPPVGISEPEIPRALARIELPSEVLISKVEVKNPPTPKSAERVEIVDGRLVVCDDLRKFWISELDGDEKRFNLALIEIGDSLQPNSRRPLESQLGSRMARIAADKRDRDARYRSAVKANAGTRAAVDQRREDPYHIGKLTGPKNIKPAPGSDYVPEPAHA